MAKGYLVSTKKPGLQFKILGGKRQEDGSVLMRLEGAHGVTFERKVTDAILQQYGYVVQTVEQVEGAVAPA